MLLHSSIGGLDTPLPSASSLFFLPDKSVALCKNKGSGIAQPTAAPYSVTYQPHLYLAFQSSVSQSADWAQYTGSGDKD